MERTFFSLGALFAAIAVAAGAFGAHALRARVEPRVLETFETAARYQMYHALALIAVAWALTRWPSSLINTSGWLFVAGIVLFSGSLYAYVFSGIRTFAIITPFGGVCWILAWLLLAIAVRKG